MEQTKKRSFLDEMQRVLVPLGNMLANQRHLASISAGLMSTVALTMVGAIFQIIATPPVTAKMMAEGGLLPDMFGWWYNFALENKALLSAPFNMTLNIFAVIVAFTVAYNLAKSYKMKALSSGIISMVMFLMVAAPATNFMVEKTSILAINMEYLGGVGLFTAMVIALCSVEITRFCIKHNITIKMPDVVPPSLADSFTAMIPLLVNVIIIYGINVISITVYDASIPKLIMNILATPLGAANSIPGVFILIIFGGFLWIFGIHGTMVIVPLAFTIMIPEIMKNAALVEQGLDPVFSPVMLFGSIALAGGTGNTIGLAILSLRSKSQQMKAIGKVGIVPAFFGINEPVIFGMPIIFNPILAIPFVLSIVVIGLIQWGAYAIGFLKPTYILILSLMPMGLGQFLSSMSWTNALFPFLMIFVSIIVYYPFFKIYERQLVEKEALVAKAHEEAANVA